MLLVHGKQVEASVPPKCHFWYDQFTFWYPLFTKPQTIPCTADFTVPSLHQFHALIAIFGNISLYERLILAMQVPYFTSK
jgi:hypothetical protein